MCIVMGADTALNSQPAASPRRWLQFMKTIQDPYYPFKVWFTTILTAPLLQVVFIVFYLGHGGVSDFFSALIFLILFSILFSIPILVIFFASYTFLNSKIKYVWLLKFILLSICIVLFLSTDYSVMYFFNKGYEHIKSKFFVFAYSICIVTFGIYYGRTN